jgi:hypothetical protein
VVRCFFSIVIALSAYRLSGANQFAAMRIESNQARWTFQQLRLAVRLTYRLYALYYRIEAIKSMLEVCFIITAHHTINNGVSVGS